MGKEYTAQTCNGNIWGGSDDTETLELLNDFEAFCQQMEIALSYLKKLNFLCWKFPFKTM